MRRRRDNQPTRHDPGLGYRPRPRRTITIEGQLIDGIEINNAEVGEDPDNTTPGFGVYFHLFEGGVSWLHDFKTHPEAEAYADFIGRFEELPIHDYSDH